MTRRSFVSTLALIVGCAGLLRLSAPDTEARIEHEETLGTIGPRDLIPKAWDQGPSRQRWKNEDFEGL